MNSMPIFWIKPGLQFPRPDRLHLKSPFTRDKLADEDAQRISALACTYGLSLLNPVEKIETNGRSQNWLLITNNGKKILKQYKPTVAAEQILHEHSILSELSRIQFPAPLLNQNLQCETLTEIGANRFALFNYLDGYFQYHEQIYFPSQAGQFLELAAVSLACLHEALRDFTPVGKNPNGFISKQGPRWRDLNWYLEELGLSRQETQERLKVNPQQELYFFHSRSQWIENRLIKLDERLSAAVLERVVIHGDYGPYNLLFKNGSPVVMIDFELSRLDWRLTDLASCLNTFARNRLGFQQRKMRRFIHTYQSASNVKAEQLDYLPMVWEYLSLRRLIVCWRRALQTGQKKWLLEALDRMHMIDWITIHQDEMLQLIKH